MGTVLRLDESQPIEEQMKFFADEELLDMWTSVQQLGFICGALENENNIPFCEPMIVRELALRVSRRLVTTNR